MTSSDTHNSSTEKNEIVRISEYPVTTDLYPWITDHIFQNVSVLPGSFVIDIACGISRELYLRFPSSIENLKFINPAILTSEGIKLVVNAAKMSTHKRKLYFSETNYFVSNDGLSNTFAEVELNLKTETNFENSADFSFFDFLKSAKETDPSEFYSDLYKNGNQYGIEFRNIEKIWSKENRAAAKLKRIKTNFPGKIHLIHPALLDSAIQLISLLSKSKTTFVLDSIREVKILNTKMQQDIWCTAELISNVNQDGFEGDAGILNDEGELCILLSGMRFKYPDQTLPKKEIRKKVILAANFTIDPIEDSLIFWNDYFRTPFTLEFAPFNQVFQQLLDSSSSFHKNNSGINILLLNLQEWFNREKLDALPFVKDEAYSTLIKDKPVYILPNKLEIVHINKYETDYLYNEIFREEIYQKKDIRINENDTVIDIGANIGLFTLYVNTKHQNVRVFSYEPSPATFDLLKINAQLYCKNTKVFNRGVSDKKRKALFTFYPNSSVFSGFEADQVEDSETIRQVIHNTLRDESGADDSIINTYINEITGDRLKKEIYECELITVSDIIRENNLDEINLLKIDAEKSEIDILEGIEEEDWPKIKQIVIEIHDKTGSRFLKAKEILRSKGFYIEIDEDTKLRGSGLFNLYAKRKINGISSIGTETRHSSVDYFTQNIEHFSEALISFATQSASPVICGITPSSPEILSNEKINGMIRNAEQQLLKNLGRTGNIFTISSNDFLTAFNLRNYYDKTAYEIGHIPYTTGFYASLGTMIFRKSFSLISAGCKVIVLDCDNTLWKGLCGEDGYEEIQLTENYKLLQHFMLEQFNSGKLLCLCSKNNQEDIDSVFDNRKEMIIKKEHIIASRINWKSKSENIKSLIAELNLSPDSFVFIDDNPVECAEVRNNCPGVITLNLPQNENDFHSFLKNIWLFDNTGITEEDKKRTNYYRSNILRNRYKETTQSLKDFIDGLNLNISITDADERRLNRAAQLTFRTNQFNFTTIRRNESEIKLLLNDANYRCLLTEVSDRFGDYGITGVLIYLLFNRKIMVDTFLLSCRVLGKGVEYKILSELGKKGLKENIGEIEIKYIQSGKNKPALDLMNSLNPQFKKEENNTIIFTFTPEYLSELKYEINDTPIELIEEDKIFRMDLNDSSFRHFSSDHFQKITDELSEINLLLDKISGTSTKNKSELNTNIVPPQTGIEHRLSEIWQRILGIMDIGIHDNFFDCGGNSLKAIQLISEIKKNINKEISIIDLFESPTISSLAEKLGTHKPDRTDIPYEIPDKGIKKRKNLVKRKRIE